MILEMLKSAYIKKHRLIALGGACKECRQSVKQVGDIGEVFFPDVLPLKISGLKLF